MTRRFGSSDIVNPFDGVLDDSGLPIFSEKFEEHHGIARDIFKSDGNDDYIKARVV